MTIEDELAQAAHRAAGKVKEAAGTLTGDSRLAEEGRTAAAASDARIEVERAGRRVQGRLQRAMTALWSGVAKVASKAATDKPKT